MKKIMLFIVFLLLVCTGLSAQNTIKGMVVHSDTEIPLQGVSVTIERLAIEEHTGIDGVFVLQNMANGDYFVKVSLQGFETQKFPITLTGSLVDLGTLFMYEDLTSEEMDVSIIAISDDELSADTSAADNISGLLQSSKDVYLRSAAYEFSASFFKIRGLDSGNGTLLLNGVEMNKAYSGRPQWSNWGGLNDVLRNQEFSSGLSPSNYTFGGVLGSTNMHTRASEARPGVRVSYASSNRSYTSRVMATYASGMLDKGWAYTISASRRAGNEGFSDGTFYNANSFFTSVEKKINDQHSFNLTAILAPNRRGKSSANTQEVYDLKGIKYNAYWGMQGDKIRNSRVKEVVEPIAILSHYWTLNDRTSINTNIAYQFGKTGNSRIDYGGSTIDGAAVDGEGNPYIVGLGGASPDPTYYQKLPSYGIRNGVSNVYEIEQAFLSDGQIRWDDLYRANFSNNGNSTYIQYEDRNDDKQFTANAIFDTEISDHLTINAKVTYKNLQSHNFANVLDLLGGNGYLDVDRYADDFNEKQNNLLNPLHHAAVGDTFKYNFNLFSKVMKAFAQAQFTYNKADFFFGATASNTTYQREGLFQNGGFADNSLGKSPSKSFTNFGAKGGLTYKISGRHLINANAGYLSKAPTLRSTFSNARENNSVVENLVSENILSADASYIIRSPKVQAKITGYYAGVQDATEISFYYADGIGGDNTAFVQEVLTGINKQHFGTELGIEVQVTPTIKLKGAANFGQYTYTNNPNLYLTTENNSRAVEAGFVAGRKDIGPSNLKNYKLAVGPQNAASVGFEYRDPNYWWISATANFFDNAYVDVAPLTRTSNFADDGGVPFNDYDPALARTLLQQEKFDNYMVVNAIGGKSWKIGKRYVSIFASVSNLLNTTYKTGGFEQGRNANYRQLRDDKALDTPVFGNKYWYGRGTTYFVSLTYRF